MKKIHKNLRKVLAIVLVCAMLTMSMGAYSGEVAYASEGNDNGQLSMSPKYILSCGEYELSYSSAKSFTAQEQYLIKNRITGIIDGSIDAVNEDSDSNMIVYIGNQPSSKISSAVGKENDLLLDVRKVSYNEIDDTEVYQAIAIYRSSYNVLNKSDESILCDVKIGGAIEYEKKTIYDGGTQITVYRINKVLGEYISSNDSQMVCKEMSFLAGQAGAMYDETGEFIEPAHYRVRSSEIAYPKIGDEWLINTEFNNYVEGTNGWAYARVYFTVSRYVSAFEAEDALVFDFGNGVDISAGEH